MRNYGKLDLRLVKYEDRHYGVPVMADTGKPWMTVAEPVPGTWFIVAVDGVIVSAEEDPMQSLIIGHDIIQIEHTGPGEVLRGKTWDGEKIV